jgi:hypothetical protein
VRSVRQLNKGWTVRGMNSSGGKTFHAIQPPVQWVLGLSRGLNGQSMALITHLLVVLGCKQVGAIVSPLLCVCIGISLGDL